MCDIFLVTNGKFAKISSHSSMIRDDFSSEPSCLCVSILLIWVLSFLLHNRIECRPMVWLCIERFLVWNFSHAFPVFVSVSLSFLSFFQLYFQHVFHLLTYLTSQELSIYYSLALFEMLLYQVIYCVVIGQWIFWVERLHDVFHFPSFTVPPHKVHAPLTTTCGQFVLQAFLVVLCIFPNVCLKLLDDRFLPVTLKVDVLLLSCSNVKGYLVGRSPHRGMVRLVFRAGLRLHSKKGYDLSCPFILSLQSLQQKAFS